MKMETDAVGARVTADSTLINVSNDIAMRVHDSLQMRSVCETNETDFTDL